MNTSTIITAILKLLAGIGVFLTACGMMSSGLETAGSSKLKKMFSKASGSRLLGVGIGAAGTAAIQSSGATTVMLIGFVNAGIITLSQAAAMVFGSNIGTTITGHIVALGMFGSSTISSTIIFSALAGFGAFLNAFSKKESRKTAGSIIAGFGMLFVGLAMMSDSMSVFAALERVRMFLAGIGSPILLVAIGAVLTAVIQSSSVMTSIAITMVVSGLISLDQGIYLTMGSNIGSCIVAVIAGMTGGSNAKRTALIHLTFNIGGVVLFLIIGVALRLITSDSVTLGSIFKGAFPGAPQTQLAMFHTIFNVISAAAALPLTRALVKLATWLIPDKSTEEKPVKLYYLDNNMLVTPPIAVAQVKNEIVNMADIAIKNFILSLKIICSLDYSEIDSFRANEEELNYLNREIVKFLVKLSGSRLNARDQSFVSSAFRSVADLERIGDYAENIVEYADVLKTSGDRFSVRAVSEINEIKTLMETLFEHVMKAYIHRDISELALANTVEDKIDELTDRMADNHITRLNEGVCTPSVGAQYLSLSSNAERVADHFINIANTIKVFS